MESKETSETTVLRRNVDMLRVDNVMLRRKLRQAWWAIAVLTAMTVLTWAAAWAILKGGAAW